MVTNKVLIISYILLVLITFDNGLELTGDIHYWQTEADNVYYPYFVQQNYDAGYIINNDGEILGDGWW